MTQTPELLSDLTPERCPPGLHWPRYARDQVRIGIAHIGVGGFHRAHQARYIDDYMAASGDLNWGICGIGLMPGDEPLIRMLERQNGLYTLTEKDDGVAHSRVIGAITRVMFAPADVDAVVAQLSDPAIRIISMTITEGGYRYDLEQDRFLEEHPDIVHDLNHPEAPRTVFGYLWRAGRRRAQWGDDGRVTLLSCDNVPHNGDVLRKAMLAFIDRAEPELRPWFEEAVTYPNAMVDRITPAPSREDVDYIEKTFQVADPGAVGCETFRQWVIEDRFATERPELETVGVQFAFEVTPFEQTKLRVLNGSHLVMAFVGYLAGYERVDQAIQDPAIRRLVTDYMVRDAEPTLPSIDAMPIKAYQATLIERFGNSRIADRMARICSDGYAKVNNYLMPVIHDLIERRADTSRLSLTCACFLAYLNGRADDGSELTVTEYTLSDEQIESTRSDRLALLKTPAFFGSIPGPAQQSFLNDVEHWYQSIIDRGAYLTLKHSLR